MLQPYKTAEFAKDIETFHNDPKKVAKILSLIEDACEHPYSGLGKPEPLRYGLQGYWSRRIDKVNRLIYRVIEPDLILISCVGHYGR
ncbi:MAG: Txe/YoeB family addiction module toxin [Coriobacteriia bacterium]|nr:Txe/YoeB family addiction module toxin [Coriobacteriia bacterium]